MFKTLHSKPGAYEGSSGAAVLNLGGESKSEAVEFSGDKGDEISIMSDAPGKSTRSKKYNPSKEDVLEMMMKANISSEDLIKKGFRTQNTWQVVWQIVRRGIE